MSPKFSIIVPTYNAAELVRDTLDCILTQNYSDYELIIVDDGSTDDTMRILSEYAEKDARIRVLSQKNAGPADARNLGLENARGEYILFVDSDDTVRGDALTCIADKLAQNPCDMLIFGFRIRNVSGGTDFIYSYSEQDLTDSAEMGKHFGPLYQSNLLNQVWNKAYRAKILHDNGCRFPDYRYGEDRLFVFGVLQYCKTVYVTDQCLYDYYIRSKESLVTKFYDRKFEVCNLFDETVRRFEARYGISGQESHAEVNYMYLKSILSCETNLYLPSCPFSRKEKANELRQILQHEQVKRALAEYQRHGFVMNAVVFVQKTGWVWLNRAMAWTISFVSRHFSTAFIRAKHPEATAIRN